MVKWCNHCKRFLPIEEFNVARYYTNGHQTYCRTCQREVGKQSYWKKKNGHLDKQTDTINNTKFNGMELHQIIKERRLDLNMSQTDVANKAGLKYQTVLSVEKGRSTTTTTLNAILDVLGLKFIVVDK